VRIYWIFLQLSSNGGVRPHIVQNELRESGHSLKRGGEKRHMPPRLDSFFRFGLQGGRQAQARGVASRQPLTNHAQIPSANCLFHKGGSEAGHAAEVNADQWRRALGRVRYFVPRDSRIAVFLGETQTDFEKVFNSRLAAHTWSHVY